MIFTYKEFINEVRQGYESSLSIIKNTKKLLQLIIDRNSKKIADATYSIISQESKKINDNIYVNSLLINDFYALIKYNVKLNKKNNIQKSNTNKKLNVNASLLFNEQINFDVLKLFNIDDYPEQINPIFFSISSIKDLSNTNGRTEYKVYPTPIVNIIINANYVKIPTVITYKISHKNEIEVKVKLDLKQFYKTLSHEMHHSMDFVDDFIIFCNTLNKDQQKIIDNIVSKNRKTQKITEWYKLLRNNRDYDSVQKYEDYLNIPEEVRAYLTNFANYAKRVFYKGIDYDTFIEKIFKEFSKDGGLQHPEEYFNMLNDSNRKWIHKELKCIYNHFKK